MHPPTNPIASIPAAQRTEIAVIGSGPGGSVTAALLAEAGRQVLLVEEGPFLPGESCPPFSRQEMEQKYRGGGLTVALGRAKIAYVEGRCVGGGSEINSGLYYRTPAEILEAWRREFGVEALREEDLRPHFEATERDLHVACLPGPAPAASLKLQEGASRLGWSAHEVPRWYCYGAETDKGVRQTMTRTYVPRALAAGATLLPQTRVLRLARRKGRWQLWAEAREADGRARPIVIEAETVFVAGGAIQTPALLRRSGLSRQAGRQLHMHPTIKVVARFAEPVNDAGMGVPVHQVKEFAPRISLGGSVSSPPYLALAMLDHPAHAGEVLAEWRHCAVYYAMTRGGVGSVRPLPWFRDPLVRYHLHAGDLAELAEGLRLLCQCLLAAGATALYPCIRGSRPMTNAGGLNAIDGSLAAGASLMTIHLFSSCPLGENRARCVANSFGLVHGLERLWLADASLLCGPPGVNPQGSIMAIVRRNVAHFLECNA